MKIAARLILLYTLTMLFSCSSKKQPTAIFGYWEASYVEIHSKEYGNEIFPISEYGSAQLQIKPDSSFYVDIYIFRDIVLKKNVFGNSVNKTILEAEYIRQKRGKLIVNEYQKANFIDHNNQVFLKSDSLFVHNEKLNTYYTDQNNIEWHFTWEQ